MKETGLKLAALYGLKPHELGFCGPKIASKQRILRRFIAGEVSADEARKVLEQFEGAYVYYKLIAKCNSIEDPFDERVVKAYWIGNGLLDAVKDEDLKRAVEKDFAKPNLLPKEIAKKRADAIFPRSRPHHSFHALFLGSVTGKVDLSELKLKDFCRVSWGEVVEIQNKKEPVVKIVVKFKPLIFNKILKIGSIMRKEIIWDKTILPDMKKGDQISFHWNLALQILEKEDIKNLEKYTINTLKTFIA